MTKTQFIATAASYPNDINIWYTPAPGPYYIQGITVPVITTTGESLLTELQQASVITLEVQQNTYVQLPVTNGQTYTGNNVQYYFLEVTPPYDITSVATSVGFATSVPLTTILFSNTVNQQAFNASGYSAILNNAEVNRTSTYILQEDGITPASVQDSLYSSTGWVNGRYDGSKTSELTYVGISPTVVGNAFQGSYFPRTVTDTEIKAQIAAGTVVFTEYLNTGTENIPSYFTYQGVYIIAAALNSNDVGTIAATGSEIPLLLKAGSPLSTRIPQIGDILQISPNPELIKIKGVGSYTNNGDYAWTQPLYRLTVERGYNYTTPAPIVTSTSPSLVTPSANLSQPLLLFQLRGNKIQGLQRGKLAVKASGEILHVDRLGYVVSGSF